MIYSGVTGVLYFTHSGMVKAIEADSFHNTANDKGLSTVVEKWLGRTIKKKRTWQTLLDVAKKLGDHEMLKYLDKNGISSKRIILCCNSS